MKEVHGVISGKNDAEIIVRDDPPFVRLCVMGAWQQLTVQEAKFISVQLSYSVQRVLTAEGEKPNG